MTLIHRVKLICLLCFLVCTIGCDQATKHLARSALPQAGSVIVSGGLVELRLAENSGSFLGFGALLPESVRFVLFVLIVGSGLLTLAVYLTSRAQIAMMRFVGLSLVMSGGIGNLFDRLFRQGLVTDFAIIHIGPVHTGIINVADILIVIGVGILIFTFGRTQDPNVHLGAAGNSR